MNGAPMRIKARTFMPLKLLYEIPVLSPCQDPDNAAVIALKAPVAQKLGGREAERIMCGDVSAGAGGSAESDLAVATNLAASYHGSWGLGDLGALWMGAPDELTGPVRPSMLTTPIRRTLDHATTEARRALAANRAALERLAEALQRSHYLDASQVREAAGAVVTLKHRLLPGLGSVVEQGAANSWAAPRGGGRGPVFGNR